MQKAKRSLLLFDLDGTLTPARQSIIPEMVKCLTKIKSKFDLAIVGGSDRKKQLEQLGEGNVHLFKYIFSENGTHSFNENGEFHKMSISDFLGEEKMKKFVNYTLRLLSETDGKFILFKILYRSLKNFVFKGFTKEKIYENTKSKFP